MHDVKYKSSQGLEINLNTGSIKLLSGSDFFNQSYRIDSIPSTMGVGSIFNRVTMLERTYKFSLWITSIDVLDTFINLYSYDIDSGIAGKLYVNGSYIDCFVSETSHPDPKRFSEGEIVEYVVTCLTPLWIKEDRYEFVKQSGELEGGLQLPFSFPLSFKLSRTSQAINNRNTRASKAELIFYGPFLEVDISIGNCRYQVGAELLENERLVINQREKTVTKITMAGDHINMFNFRNKENSVFKPIPPGEHLVSANMEYSFEIIVFEERGMPSWNSYMRENSAES